MRRGDATLKRIVRTEKTQERRCKIGRDRAVGHVYAVSGGDPSTQRWKVSCKRSLSLARSPGRWASADCSGLTAIKGVPDHRGEAIGQPIAFGRVGARDELGHAALGHP